MDPGVVAALVSQAAAAESRLAQLEARLQQPAGGAGGPSAASVADLQELRDLLLRAKAENEQLRSERDAAVKAARAAEVEQAKAGYRILHLVRSLREAEAGGVVVARGS